MGGRRILSDQQLEEMVALRERGWGSSRIAAHFTNTGTPVSVGSINWQCLRLGAEPPPRLRATIPSQKALKPYRRNGFAVKRFSPEDDQVLRDLDAKGARVSEMARKLDRPANSVRGRLFTLARHEARAEAFE